MTPEARLATTLGASEKKRTSITIGVIIVSVITISTSISASISVSTKITTVN